MAFNARNMDPSRTTGLRRRFAADMTRRWNAVIRDVRVSIVDHDCFGIAEAARHRFGANSPLNPKQFAFLRNPEKVRLFMAWLEQLEEQQVFSIARQGAPRIGLLGPLGGGLGAADPTRAYGTWTDDYLLRAYEQGVDRANAEMIRAGFLPGELGLLPRGSATAGFLLTQGHRDRVQFILSRTFEDLRTVQAVTNAAVRRSMIEGLTIQLSQGIASGVNPNVIARSIAADAVHHLDNIGIVRSRMIARTEVLRSHHLAQIQSYREVDASMFVDVQVEVLLGQNPCPICIALHEQGPYSLDRAEGMLPAHPNCVCALIPLVKLREFQESFRRSGLR